MLHLLQRHPRYAILILFLVVSSFFYLNAPYPTFEYSASTAGYPGDPSLPARVERAELAYRRVVEKRQSLIRKHGPSPSQVVMFPPDREPWPAYTVWDFFPGAFNCPHELERVGTLGDGGKWTCGLSRVAQKPDCVIYSFGQDWDSSWEAAVLEATQHCQIWGYDYRAKSFGGHVSHVSLSRRQRAHWTTRVQLGPEDNHSKASDPQLYTLETLMESNGHTFVDILKVDLEAYEFDTFKAMLQPYVDSGRPLPFGQLQIELHLWHQGQRFAQFLEWWNLFEDAGLRPVAMEPNLVYVNYNRQKGAELAEYTFLNIKGDNVFIADPEPFAPSEEGTRI